LQYPKGNYMTLSAGDPRVAPTVDLYIFLQSVLVRDFLKIFLDSFTPYRLDDSPFTTHTSPSYFPL